MLSRITGLVLNEKHMIYHTCTYYRNDNTDRRSDSGLAVNLQPSVFFVQKRQTRLEIDKANAVFGIGCGSAAEPLSQRVQPFRRNPAPSSVISTVRKESSAQL